MIKTPFQTRASQAATLVADTDITWVPFTDPKLFDCASKCHVRLYSDGKGYIVIVSNEDEDPVNYPVNHDPDLLLQTVAAIFHFSPHKITWWIEFYPGQNGGTGLLSLVLDTSDMRDTIEIEWSDLDNMGIRIESYGLT